MVWYNESMSSTQKDLTIIGNNALVSIAGIKNIPAKVDTGADSSSLWASDIKVGPDGILRFKLLGPESSLYSGEEITTKDYSVQQVRNSTGDVKVRYRVTLAMKVKDRNILTSFTLADRSHNRFPVLIGRRTLQNKFLVDVSKVSVPRPATFQNEALNNELQNDPEAFHQKYMENNGAAEQS